MLSMDASIYIFEVVEKGVKAFYWITKRKEGNEPTVPTVPPCRPPNSLSIRDTQITAGLWVEHFRLRVLPEGVGQKRCKDL